jgi:beta-phosphoglucomutase
MGEVGGIAIIADSQGAGEFTAYPDALRFIIAVKDAGIHVAAASSSKNAGLFLRQIRLDTFAGENGLESERVTPGLTLLEFFDADISGRDFAHGKPHPEIFLTGAKELGVPPEECFVVEDAVSGIQAAKAGGMAALGLPRAHDEELLAAAEPDVLVTSLDDVASTRWPKASWRRGAPNRRRSRSTRGSSHGRPARRRRPGGL